MRFNTLKTTEGQANARLRKDFLNGIGGAILPNQLISLDGRVGHYVSRKIDTKKREIRIDIYLNGNQGEARSLPSEITIGSLQYRLIAAVIEKPQEEYKPWVAPKKDAVTPA